MVNSLPPPFTPHTRQISHVLIGDVYTHLICFGSIRLSPHGNQEIRYSPCRIHDV